MTLGVRQDEAAALGPGRQQHRGARIGLTDAVRAHRARREPHRVVDRQRVVDRAPGELMYRSMFEFFFVCSR